MLPTVVYFLLGALAYRTGKQLLGSVRGGMLGLLLLLGGGGLGWLFGVLQTASHASQFVTMRAALFSDWTSWDGVDSILPLVHRPAHYHSLLICLAAINLLLRPERSRRDWVLAGLLLGLMAGFNFTLAATFGVAAVLGGVVLFLQRRQSDARDLAWLALFIFLGSLPVTGGMLLTGFHNTAPGFPFRGPNLQFSTATWGTSLSQIMPWAVVPWASLIVFPILAYGIKLVGLGPMLRLDLGEDRHRSLAMVFALAFALSFVIGTFFPYQAFGGVGIVFLQPTLWILGLFSLRPINTWMEQGRGSLARNHSLGNPRTDVGAGTRGIQFLPQNCLRPRHNARLAGHSFDGRARGSRRLSSERAYRNPDLGYCPSIYEFCDYGIDRSRRIFLLRAVLKILRRPRPQRERSSRCACAGGTSL